MSESNHNNADEQRGKVRNLSAYGEGMLAFLRSCPFKENPYLPFTPNWEDWRNGWREMQRIAAQRASEKARNDGLTIPHA